MAVPPRRWIPIVIAGGVALYGIVHIYGAHSEAFEFIDQTVRASAAIHSRVGNVQSGWARYV